jgi:tetratricopeptide (TPR) repeat protein
MKKTSRAMVLIGILAATCGPIAAQVKVWPGTLNLPTYEEGKPDPNPPFDTYATTKFSYPYTLRNNLTGRKQDHAWRAIFLENEYLKCSVLPDIGGHLYTCIDKISGESMFYANPSIKKAQIGYRGAWAAFGIEFNFPVSHNWVSMSPIDFSYGIHSDGSASVSIGNVDRVYGMQWRVELVLRPGSTLLEERVTLYNRSDVRHRYYWWNNAGVQVWDDSHIEYPMQFAASHGFTEVRHWPVGPEGADLSVIKNQQYGPVSFFVHGSHEPFMGIWNPETQTGVVHYAEYSDLPAKKIWSWGADAEGMGWRKALSDNASAYVEVQAGLFRNQETYAFLDPGQTIHFSEYWMPVRKTGGISRANRVGVLFLSSDGSHASAVLNVNQHFSGAQIRLLQQDKVLLQETVDLTPENRWSRTVPVQGSDTKVTFELKDREGNLLLSHTDGQYDWDPESTIKVGPQETYDSPAADHRSEGDWLKLGTDQELNGKLVLALETYKQGMAKNPNSFTLQMAAGRLAVSLQHYAEAETLLRAVQKRDTPNAEIAYYLGLAEQGLGHQRETKTAYEIAYRQVEFRQRAAAKLGQLVARQRNLQSALKFFAVAATPSDIRSQEQLEAVTRALGDTVGADRIARYALEMDPLSDFLKEETGAPDLPHLAADPYRVLRVANEYIDMGLYQKALTVLERIYPQVPLDQSEPGSVLPQDHPMVLYYVAYCKANLHLDDPRNWQRAQRLSPSLVFPSSTMDEIVLNAALGANPNDGTAQYLLGTLLFSKGLHDSAMGHWTQAKRLLPTLPILDADMGKAWLHLKADPQRALKSFQQGVRNDPSNAEVYVGLDEAMSLTGISAADRAEALGRYPSASDKTSLSAMPSNLVYQLALTRAEAGQYDEALDLFKDRFFPSEEGGVSAAQVLFEIKLVQAEAEATTGECKDAEEFISADHPGMEINGAVSQAYVRMSAIAKECKRPEQAQQLLRNAAASKSGADAAWVVKAEKLLGTDDAARQQLELQTSLAAAERTRETSSFAGWWRYNCGTMEAALNHKDRAREAFNSALLLPDSMMSHHLSRIAKATLDTEQ